MASMRMRRRRGGFQRVIQAARHGAVECLESRVLLSVTLPDDVNSVQTLSSDIGWYSSINDRLVFTANDGFHGGEIFTSQGTAATTSMLADLNPAYGVGSSAYLLKNVHGTVYFTANDGSHGQEFWKTDGTAAGTVMLKDILPGSENGSPFSFTPGPGSTVLFLSNGSVGRGVWVSDGTPSGTTQMGTIDTTNGRSLSGELGIGEKLYYFVRSGTATELWSFDGTAAPQLVVTVNNAYFSDFHALPDGSIGFVNNTDNSLWKSDGTASGTAVVAQFGSKPNIIDTSGTALFIVANDATGTARTWGWVGANTAPEVLGAASLIGGNFASLNGSLYFRSTGGTFWRSDGTPEGTQQIVDFGKAPGATPGPPISLYSTGGRLYFPALDSVTGAPGLYVSDGTGAGTHLLATFPSFNSIQPKAFFAVGGLVYFTAGDSNTGNELWVTDNTASGTHLVKDIYPVTDPSNPSMLGVFKGRIYFLANDGIHGLEPWSTDGTPGGAALLADLNPTTSNGPINLGMTRGAATSKYLYFRAYDGAPTSSWYQLWRTDGTAAGTIKLQSFFRGGVNSFGVMNDTIYFTVDLAPGLWTSDGTPEGTKLIPGSDAITSISTTMDGVLYCLGKDADTGIEIWRSDGTAGGTYRVTDVNPGAANSFPTGMTAVDHTLFFFADSDSTLTNDLYTYTVNTGVNLVKRIGTGNDFNSGTVAVVAGRIFFQAFDDVTGGELWVSDGTAAGTHLVKDLKPGVNGSNIEQIFAVNGVVVFMTGSQFYRSDGTAEGTYPLGDVVLSATPRRDLANLYLLGDYAYFAGKRNGVEALWRTDGTVAGTTMVADMPVNVSYNLAQFASLGNDLYFNGIDPLKGQELWKYSPDDPALASPAMSFTPTQGVRLQFDRPLADDAVRVAINVHHLLAFDRFYVISPTAIATAVNPSTGTVAITFPGYPGGILPDGEYLLTVPAGFLHDTAGNPLASDVTSDFAVLSGDANQDRVVDFNDLVRVAQHYNAGVGMSYSDGDFNGDGTVDFNDLVILAQHYNTTLTLPYFASTPAASASAASISVVEKMRDEDETSREGLTAIFNTQSRIKAVRKPSAARSTPRPPVRRV